MSHSVASTKKESLAPIYTKSPYRMGLPRWLSGKESACNAGDPGDMGPIHGLGGSPEEEKGNPLQYSSNSMGKFYGKENLAGYSP